MTVKVLVVDDEPITRQVVCKQLEKLGYEPKSATGGTDALKKLEVEDFHLMIVDVMMPDIDGFALINMFKQALKKDIPTIMMSSSANPSTITQVFKHGAEDFLQKPIKEEMLAARIKKTFEIRDQQQRQKKLEEQVRIEQKFVETMSEQIEKNKKEIFEYKKNVSDTIETPLEFIIGTIKDMMNNKIEKNQYKVALMTILKSLGGSDLYKPAFVNLLQSSNVDDSTRSWLISQYTKDSTTNYKMPMPIASKPQQNDKLPFDLDACVPPAEVNKIGFNALKLNHSELKQMVMYMFKSLDLFNQFKLPPVNLWNLLNMLEKEYKANYYHNFKHCIDVTQYVYMLITDVGLAALLSPFHKFTLLIAALCHDVDHPGLNNNFLINSHHELANTYNDKSVLENHHASRSSYLMNEGATNVLCGLTQEQYREFRRIFTQLILATDMANHFNIVSKFELKVTTSTWTSENTEDMTLLLRVIIKCADISNVTRPFDVAKQWAALCLEEFSTQGDKEKEYNLPISPLMDRDKLNIPKSQIDFTDFIVAPLFKNLVASFPTLHVISTNIQENRKTWKLMMDFLEKEKMTGPYKLAVALQKLADFEAYLQTQTAQPEQATDHNASNTKQQPHADKGQASQQSDNKIELKPAEIQLPASSTSTSPPDSPRTAKQNQTLYFYLAAIVLGVSIFVYILKSLVVNKIM